MAERARPILDGLSQLFPDPVMEEFPSSTENRRQALMEPPLRESLVNSGRGGTSVFRHRRLEQLLILRLGFLQVGIAAFSGGRPTRRDRSWKRGLSRKPSMLGSI